MLGLGIARLDGTLVANPAAILQSWTHYYQFSVPGQWRKRGQGRKTKTKRISHYPGKTTDLYVHP